MAVNSCGHRLNKRSSKRAGKSLPALLTASGFLILLVLPGGHIAAQTVAGAGMKDPPGRPPAVTVEVSDTAVRSSSRQLLLVGIRFFQRWVSPIDGPRCNFTPTCSHFGSQAVQGQGILLGMVLTADRLMRCHYLVESDAGYERLPGGRLYDPVVHNLPAQP